jgi:hypothetical protein
MEICAMDIGLVVNYLQLGIWLVAVILYFGKLLRRDTQMRGPVTALFSSNQLLGAVVAIGLALSAICLYRRYRPNIAEYPFNKTQEIIVGQKFSNEAVEVDGKRFEHCEFRNVTLIYHGLAAYLFDQAKFSGNIEVQTDNISIEAFESLQQSLQRAPGVTHFFTGLKDKNGNITKLNEYVAPISKP